MIYPQLMSISTIFQLFFDEIFNYLKNV